MIKITDYSHIIIKEHLNNLNKDNIRVCDATCGLGNDTIFMAKLLNDKGIIDSYDIQEAAINETKIKLNNEKITNVNLIHKSHEYLDPSLYDLIIFNLGYLPKHDKTITTKKDIIIPLIGKIIEEMDNNNDLLLLLTIYPGHAEGLNEANAIENRCKTLDSAKYIVTKLSSFNQNNSPYIITIEYKHKNR